MNRKPQPEDTQADLVDEPSTGTGAGTALAGGRRRRGEELEGALLDAAWQELQANGYAGLTFDAVAARAQTSKPVLYRRWPTKADLVVAAMKHAGLFERRALPDTGSLREDVLTSLRNFNESRADFITAIGLYMANIASDTGLSPADLRARLLGDRVAGGTLLLERAVRRGEVPDRPYPPGLATMPFDLFRHDLTMTLARVPEWRILEIVDDLWLPLLTREA
ncbi:TetR/AcrR family transcriptional regulator [Microlunatus flavus]|uniref:DNA-binding transcriptional regulator, AcrR family n=1 Tax=Microlunatus flavus TaxID=1036181 RepID=A0A1H9ETY2_9ACTN|nr:TetR/AcrR family transcriptional regulator [Microlunatus flavus]SEQ28448.1 DNA-binding transcriptional regulator, AcrR family [Microlunatus flavus]